MKPSCSSCRYLRKCKIVTVVKIETGYRCEDWVVEESIELRAREDIIEDFGLWALKFDIPKFEKKRGPKARRRKKDGS